MSDLLSDIQPQIDLISKAGNNPGHIGAERAKIDAILVEALTRELLSFSGRMEDAATILGTRIDGLAEEMKHTRTEMREASEAASKHAFGLVLWTRLLVLVTVLYTVVAGAQLVVAWMKIP